MEIMRLAGLLSLLTLTACHSVNAPDVTPVKNSVPTKWHFNFFTPTALPALVTLALVQDIDYKVYEFNTFDSMAAPYGVIGRWNDLTGVFNGYWNQTI